MGTLVRKRGGAVQLVSTLIVTAQIRLRCLERTSVSGDRIETRLRDVRSLWNLIIGILATQPRIHIARLFRRFRKLVGYFWRHSRLVESSGRVVVLFVGVIEVTVVAIGVCILISSGYDAQGSAVVRVRRDSHWGGWLLMWILRGGSELFRGQRRGSEALGVEGVSRSDGRRCRRSVSVDRLPRAAG